MGGVDLINDIADALRAWLPGQRWFAGKGRELVALRPVRTTVLGGEDPQLVHAVVEVDQGGANGGGPNGGTQSTDRYQLVLGVRHHVPEHLGHAWIADGELAVYQAVHDPELTTVLLRLLAENADVEGVRFATEPGVELEPDLRARPINAEQSNTSLVFGQRYILKLFRRLGRGRSPDLELHRALAAAGCRYIAAPLGSIEGELDGEIVTYGILQDFLPNTADGWAMATASVRDLLASSQDSAGPETLPHADEVGGDFASEAHRLGHAVAAVHADLANALGTTPASPEELAAAVDAMHHRLDGVLAHVPDLAAHEAALRAAFDEVRSVEGPVAVQRVHGDLHLGQVLRHVTGWVLIDFEGEPMAPLADRIAPGSPLRDVAGMLRSFDYAAHHFPLGDGDPERHAAITTEWARRNCLAFAEGYAEVGDDPMAQRVLLRAFELEKAVYEVGYEHAHRPGWLPIPLAAIHRLTGAGSNHP